MESDDEMLGPERPTSAMFVICLVVATMALLAVPATASAQSLSSTLRAPVAAPVPPNSSGALALEAGAGALGSLAGMAIVGLSGQCGDRNFDDPVFVIPIFAVSQDVFAALGSRLLSAR